MDNNQLLIQNLKMNEVPWHRITTAYGRATEFPKYLKTLWDMADMPMVKQALDEITIHIEHQGTLWHSTPFSIIFLVRIFQRAVSEMEKEEIAFLIAERLLALFGKVAQSVHDADEMEYPDQLPHFSDMLKEEYLWSEEYNEEEDELRYQEEVLPGDLLYSFYYYSYQALISCKPALKQLKSTALEAEATEFQKLLDIK